MDALAKLVKSERFSQREDYPHAQTGGLAFGWTPPSALYLPPHTSDAATVVKVFDKALLPGYMQWPGWRDGGRDALNKWKYTEPQPFVSYLELPVLRAHRQQWALTGKADDSQRVQNMLELRYDLQGKQLPQREVQSTPAPLPQIEVVDGVQMPPEADEETTQNARRETRDETGQEDLLLDSDMDVTRLTIAAYLDDEANDKVDPQLLEDQRLGAKGEDIDKRMKAGAALEPGEKTRLKDKGGNYHFYSSEYAPWPWQDLYEEFKHEYDYDDTVDVDAYEKRYGNVHNLFLGSTTPREITGVKNSYGKPKRYKDKRLLDMPLTAYKDKNMPRELKAVFEKNMRAILRIYFDDSGYFNARDPKDRWSPDTKREAMLKGLQAEAGPSSVTVSVKEAGGTELLKRVFNKAPPNVAADYTVQEGNEKVLDPRDDRTPKLPAVSSDMTVIQWLQTPFHYAYLPYQVMQSVFKEGESYCAGCTRCSRPFYEYEKLYHTYLTGKGGSIDKTQHWPFNLWRPDDLKYDMAPLPFHDPKFWVDYTVNERAPDEHNVAGETLQENRGYLNWPTRLFKLGWIDENTRDGKETNGKWREIKGQAPEGQLHKEWQQRAQSKTDWLLKNWRLNERWTFREYLNHMYAGAAAEDLLVQGKIASRNSKVAFGMRDYRLQRAAKYGNVCRDCAATLDLAPGLYNKPGSNLTHLTSVRKAGNAEHTDSWWLALKDRLLDPSKPELGTFDPWFLFLETGQDRRFRMNGRERDARATKSRAEAYKELELADVSKKKIVEDKTMSKMDKYKELWKDEDFQKKYADHMTAVLAFVRHRADCGEMGKATKVAKCDVHVQPRVELKTAAELKALKTDQQSLWDQQGTRDVQKAFEVMDKLIQWLDDAYKTGNVTPLQLDVGKEGNRSLRDMLHDSRFKLAREKERLQDPDTKIKKFDPDMRRMEFRNISIEKDGVVYDKSLRVVTYQGDGVYEGRKKEVKRVEYLYASNGSTANAHEWRGDYFIDKARVRDVGQEFGVHPFVSKQERRLTQTRVFITYSLHRRVRSEMEARYVMEKMADALRFIFSDDTYLCKMIRFGEILHDYKVNDSISRWVWKPIEKPNKDSKRGEFYGAERQGNSYQYDTYRSHVEEVSVDVGIEIGPNRHMPHFHALVTVNHWSYIHVDTRVMGSLLEQMFKGQGQFDGGGAFKLVDSDGLPFYTDNEQPYIDLDLKPSDDWSNVIAAYVRKTTMPGVFGMLRSMTGDT